VAGAVADSGRVTELQKTWSAIHLCYLNLERTTPFSAVTFVKKHYFAQTVITVANFTFLSTLAAW
jgi:hypothetical protein